MSTAFIICGSPGAGKTTYGMRLSRKRQALFLDIDTVTERMVQAGLSMAGRNPDDRDSPLFKQTFRQPIYDTLFDIARENLPWQDVVLTGPFTAELQNPSWPKELAEVLQQPVEIHYVYCPPHIRRKRMEKRKKPRDLAKLQNWQAYTQYYGSEDPPVFPHVYIDTSKKFGK